MTTENCPHCGNTCDEQSAQPEDPHALAGTWRGDVEGA